ncbi:MAG: histidine kinase, partial [Anaerolineae bacterium]
MADDPRALAALREIQVMTENTIADVRRMVRALRPIYLEDLGLVAALEMLARETPTENAPQVTFAQRGSPRRLPADVELALYRMAQEALHNALQHAHARQVHIALIFETQGVILSVQDDGQGFDLPESPAEFAPCGHFVLLGLHERGERIGARLE